MKTNISTIMKFYLYIFFFKRFVTWWTFLMASMITFPLRRFRFCGATRAAWRSSFTGEKKKKIYINKQILTIIRTDTIKTTQYYKIIFVWKKNFFASFEKSLELKIKNLAQTVSFFFDNMATICKRIKYQMMYCLSLQSRKNWVISFYSCNFQNIV